MTPTRRRSRLKRYKGFVIVKYTMLRMFVIHTNAQALSCSGFSRGIFR